MRLPTSQACEPWKTESFGRSTRVDAETVVIKFGSIDPGCDACDEHGNCLVAVNQFGSVAPRFRTFRDWQALDDYFRGLRGSRRSEMGHPGD